MKKKNVGAGNRQEKRERQEPSRSDASGNLYPRRLRIVLAIAFSCLLIFSASFLMWNSSTSPAQNGTKPAAQSATEAPKALILDGLYASSPNPAFSQRLKNYLSAAGFKVDVFQGENVTIDLLRNIAGYKILILRLHSAVHSDGFLYLFSGERYSQSKYSVEQLYGSVRKGVTFEGDEFFAVNAVFLGGNDPSGLNGSTVILMGCNGTGNALSTERLLSKGVDVYIGWNGYVDLSYSDQVTLALVRDLYVRKIVVGEAVAEAMREVGVDPVYKSVLEYRTR